MRTHPLTSQRVDYVREHVLHSPYSDVPDPPDWIEMHKRMRAKLAAFLGAPSQVLAGLKPDDNSVPPAMRARSRSTACPISTTRCRSSTACSMTIRGIPISTN